jgi:hypothetical protein
MPCAVSSANERLWFLTQKAKRQATFAARVFGILPANLAIGQCGFQFIYFQAIRQAFIVRVNGNLKCLINYCTVDELWRKGHTVIIQRDCAALLWSFPLTHLQQTSPPLYPSR